MNKNLYVVKSAATVVASLVLVLGSVGLADQGPLKMTANFDLTPASKVAGKGSYFDLMTAKKGIKAAIDYDYQHEFTVGSVQSVREGSKSFDPRVVNKILGFFKDGPKGLDQLVAALSGQRATPDSIRPMIGKILNSQKLLKNPSQGGLAPFVIAPFLTMTSGGGVAVALYPGSYFYNYGYKPGSTDKTELDEHVKSGRSYGAGPKHGALDPSDKDYLRELSVYFTSASDQEIEQFYRTMFQLLTKTDTNGFERLSDLGQTTLTDFMTIYTAELDRHLMTRLTSHEWENALAEVTLLASFSTSNDGMTFDVPADANNSAGRKVVPSSQVRPDMRMVGFFGIGTQGTGLDGRMKQFRHGVTSKVAAAERRLNPKVVSNLEALMGLRAGADVIERVMDFLNRFQTQARVRQVSDQLTESMVQFLMQVRTDAKKISQSAN